MQKTILAILVLGLFAACRQHNQRQPAIDTAEMRTQALPEGFLAFYEQFHSDSLFQLEHIHWPLEGMATDPSDTTSLRQVPTHWEKEDWHMHHAVDFKKEGFKQEFQTVGDVIVIEKIRTAVGNYGLERRFAKRGEGSWELIYYADIHEMK